MIVIRASERRPGSFNKRKINGYSKKYKTKRTEVLLGFLGLPHTRGGDDLERVVKECGAHVADAGGEFFVREAGRELHVVRHDQTAGDYPELLDSERLPKTAKRSCAVARQRRVIKGVIRLYHKRRS